MPVFAGRLQPAGPDRALREGAEEEQPDGSVRNPRGTRQPRLLRTQRLRHWIGNWINGEVNTHLLRKTKTN